MKSSRSKNGGRSKKASKIGRGSDSRRGLRGPRRVLHEPDVKVVRFSLRKNKKGAFDPKGKVIEKYVRVLKAVPGMKTKAGRKRYENVSTVREKKTGNLFKFFRDPNDVGLKVDFTINQKKTYSKLKQVRAKGLIIKIKGRGRGKKKDTTILTRVFFDPKGKKGKAYLENLITAKIMNAVRSAGYRMSGRTKRNKDFKYLANAKIEVDYYG